MGTRALLGVGIAFLAAAALAPANPPRPRPRPRPRILPRIGVGVEAAELVRGRLLVEYQPSDSAPNDRLAITDLHVRRLRDFARNPDGIGYPWLDFDGSRAVWTEGAPPGRVYTQRVVP